MQPQSLATIKLHPQFDKRGKRQLQEDVHKAVAEEKLVILDVSLLGELNSQELAAIFATVANIIERDGDVAIIGVSPQLRTLFSLVQLDRVVEICNDIEHAARVLDAPIPREMNEETKWVPKPEHSA